MQNKSNYNVEEIREDILDKLIKWHMKDKKVEEMKEDLRELQEEQYETNEIEMEVSWKLHRFEKNQLCEDNEKIRELLVLCLCILEQKTLNEEALQLEVCYMNKAMEEAKKANDELIRKIAKEKRSIS